MPFSCFSPNLCEIITCWMFIYLCVFGFIGLLFIGRGQLFNIPYIDLCEVFAWVFEL